MYQSLVGRCISTLGTDGFVNERRVKGEEVLRACGFKGRPGASQLEKSEDVLLRRKHAGFLQASSTTQDGFR